MLAEIRNELHRQANKILQFENRRPKFAIYVSDLVWVDLAREMRRHGVLPPFDQLPSLCGSQIYRVRDDEHGWKIYEMKGASDGKELR